MFGGCAGRRRRLRRGVCLLLEIYVSYVGMEGRG